MGKTLFFDFDGTIADSEKGIVNGIKYMINDLHLNTLTDAQYRDWIGPTLSASMRKYFPQLDDAGITAGIASYQEYYSDKGIFELDLYSGVTNQLVTLREAGYQVAVASSKPELMVKRIVDHFGIRTLFDGVYGASMDEKTRVSKTAVLSYAIDETRADRAHSVMIGDRYTDIEGGINNRVHTLGVTYGFGDAAELQGAGANRIVDLPTAIAQAAGELA